MVDRGSISKHNAKLSAYREAMAQYEKDTASIRREIRDWEARYGGNAGYETCLKIVEHLREDVESYIRDEFRLRPTKLSWRFLPPGPRGVAQLAEEIRALKKRYPDLKYDEARTDYAKSLSPTHMYVGLDEFDGYFAFVFTETEHVLLENPQEGNAAYIFKSDWMSLSKLPKFELLERFPHCVERVLHRSAGNWKWRIKCALRLR